MSNEMSLVASDKQHLDFGKLVSITNKAQVICIVLAADELVPDEARKLYEEANEKMTRAMNVIWDERKKWGRA